MNKILLVVLYVLSIGVVADEDCGGRKDICDLKLFVNKTFHKLYASEEPLPNGYGAGVYKDFIWNKEYRFLMKFSYSLHATVVDSMRSNMISPYEKSAIIPLLFCMDPNDYYSVIKNEISTIYHEGTIDNKIYTAFFHDYVDLKGVEKSEADKLFEFMLSSIESNLSNSEKNRYNLIIKNASNNLGGKNIYMEDTCGR